MILSLAIGHCKISTTSLRQSKMLTSNYTELYSVNLRATRSTLHNEVPTV